MGLGTLIKINLLLGSLDKFEFGISPFLPLFVAGMEVKGSRVTPSWDSSLGPWLGTLVGTFSTILQGRFYHLH